MSNFMEAMEKELNYGRTENGALGFRKTLSPIVDLNFKIPSYRDDKVSLGRDFSDALFYDAVMAIKWAFMARDCRGGAGERDLFRTLLPSILDEIQEPYHVVELIKLVPEYGRWDDLWVLFGTKWEDALLWVISRQLRTDYSAYAEGKGKVSLLAKWLPSDNASSAVSRQRASIIKRAVFENPTEYRAILKELRTHLAIVEKDMSEQNWTSIDYARVPSRAALLYRNAFRKQDEIRYEDYLESVEKGESKINAGTLFPHEIVHSYTESCGLWNLEAKDYNTTLEELWKALPNYESDGSTLVVQDSSGSMRVEVSKSSSVQAINIAAALAIYFAERATGPYKNKYITFSSRPEYVQLQEGWLLRDKLKKSYSYNIVENTNIEAVFDLILKTAVENRLDSDELPKNVLILSDMEFDQARGRTKGKKALFETIEENFKYFGYQVPKLIFWNINSRTNTIPLQESDSGLVLISGFSPATIQMVVQGILDPEEALYSMLDSPRYEKLDFLKEILRK